MSEFKRVCTAGQTYPGPGGVSLGSGQFSAFDGHTKHRVRVNLMPEEPGRGQSVPRGAPPISIRIIL
jgi:hypothetical protein